MFSRRDLVKYFGAGALIAPIVGGKAEEGKAAELIEVPKVRPVEIHKEIPKPLDLAKAKRATITFEMKDGSSRAIAFNLLTSWPGKLIRPDLRMTALLTISQDYASPAPEVGRVHLSEGVLL